MKRLVTLLMVLLLCSVLFAEGTAELTESDAGRKIPIRVLIVRSSVNMDVFMLGATPESLWGKEKILQPAESEVESADIFATATESNFKVGRIIIDAILNGTF